jgi:hypothetical protein
MDDIEDGEGIAIGKGEALATNQGTDKEITSLENKMIDLHVMNRNDVSQNSKTKTPKEHSSSTISKNTGTEPSNNLDTNKLTSSAMPKQIMYEFQLEILSGGKRPEVQCQYCKKDGHMSSRCPDLKKPTLKALQPLTSRLDELVTSVCSKTRGKKMQEFFFPDTI